MGRSDDMMKIKGVNVFPSQIEEILAGFPEVSSEYQIRISHLDGKDTMRLYVETNGHVNFLELADRIAATVKGKIGFTPRKQKGKGKEKKGRRNHEENDQNRHRCPAGRLPDRRLRRSSLRSRLRRLRTAGSQTSDGIRPAVQRLG